MLLDFRAEGTLVAEVTARERRDWIPLHDCMTPRSERRDLGHPLMVLDFSRRHLVRLQGFTR